MKKSRMISLAVAAAFALPAYAQMNFDTPSQPKTAQTNSPAPRADRSAPSSDASAAKSTFGSMDGNRDGFVSRDEARSSGELNRRFNELDKDRDGKLSAEELAGAGSAAPGSSAPATVSSPDSGAANRSLTNPPRPGAPASNTAK